MNNKLNHQCADFGEDFTPFNVGEHIADTRTNVLYDFAPIGFTDHSEQQVKQANNGITEKRAEVSEQRHPINRLNGIHNLCTDFVPLDITDCLRHTLEDSENKLLRRLNSFCEVNLLKPTVDEVCDCETELRPIEGCYKTVEGIYENRPLLRKGLSDQAEVDLLHHVIERGCDTRPDFIEVDSVEEVIQYLKSRLNTVAQLVSDTRKVYFVDKLVNLISEDFANTRPIAVCNSFLDLVYPFRKVAVKLHFLKHRAVVHTTRTTATSAVGEDIQFIKTCGKAFCGFRCATCGFGILGLSLDGFRPSTRPREFCEQLIQHIDESHGFINYILDCRSESVNERSNHRTDRVFEVQEARCNPIHRGSKVAADSFTVLIYIVRSFLECGCNLRQNETNSPIHSDTTHRANKSAELLSRTAYCAFELPTDVAAELFHCPEHTFSCAAELLKNRHNTLERTANNLCYPAKDSGCPGLDRGKDVGCKLFELRQLAFRLLNIHTRSDGNSFGRSFGGSNGRGRICVCDFTDLIGNLRDFLRPRTEVRKVNL